MSTLSRKKRWLSSRATWCLKRVTALNTLMVVLTVFLISSPFQTKSAYAQKNSLEGEKVTLSLQNKSLAEALKCLATQLNIEISANGHFPQTTGSVNLEDLQLENAIDRLMKAFGISNHAALYDLGKRVVYLNMINSTGKVCYPSAQKKGQFQPEIDDKDGYNDKVAFAEERYFEDEPVIENSNGRLTDDEIKILADKNTYSAVLAENSQSKLSDRQMDILRRKSREFKSQDTDHLTEIQKRKLIATIEDNHLL